MDIFPCEIWEEVVRKLPAFDLINFCKSSDALLYLLRDKNVVIDFDLGGCFDIYKEELYQNFYQDVGYEHIRSLNINKIYWIGLEEIRDIVRLLPHLEELRALDTILGMRNDDVVLYKKLKKLAISVEMDQFTSTREVYRECFSHLKSLCIKFVSKYRADFRRVYYMFFNELRKLDELWIYDADDLETQMLRYDYIVCNLRSLRKLVIKSKTNLTLLDYTPFGLLKIYERRRRNNSTICYEGNVEQTEKQNVFRHIINNCRYLTDLEIVSCTNMEPVDLNEECVKVPCYSSAIIGAYELISNLRHLKRLRLEVPSYLNGNFLKDVFLKCSELQSLQILSEDTNEDLNSVLYSHLNYAHKLKEFRFENVHIDLDRLFSALNKVIPSKLQRIVVKCDYEHSMQLWPLEKLLKRNCDIIFLAILVSTYNRHQINKLQELLNDFKDHPAKVYVAKTTMTPEEDLVIPEAHKDILYFSTDVSVLHFSDF
ncbi:hypothetical protein D910_11208 [Dendroctonus ponderosae]|uniref:F-box/LRR-repeat protein 18 LRR domain-containing protein n=1 Tax=Dendroctonus ponderosae TaxID=77166 RepID=U4ULD5_DENPD|nr:hypothetical protein D910_11208 [Dendroctonus ponderosae]